MPDQTIDYTEGLRLFYLKKYGEALPRLLRAAEAGDVKSQHFVAMLYENGNGVERDLEKAAYWYRRTAESGDREAMLTYAMIRALGKGTDADIADACHWASQSLHDGNEKARQTLSILRAQAQDAVADATAAFSAAHKTGDTDEALRQLRVAAECGSAGAQFALFQLLYDGQGDLPADKVAALLWLRDAAEQGHAEAQSLLAAYTGGGQA
ncbi:MAG: sel1 repeat family protein [Oscillospiraceae bacterium]|nr:sel1 repeat family protein [Oscillospiraceae bacterium]